MVSSDEVVAAVTWRMKYKVMASETATIMVEGVEKDES